MPSLDATRLRDAVGLRLPRVPTGLTWEPSSWMVSGLNALLSREPWARERLSRHAGKTVRLALGGVQGSLTITHDGRVSWAESTIVPDVTLTVAAEKLTLERLAAVRRSGDGAAIVDITHISGDAGLAQVVADLAQHLRWDVEEELAERIGDVPAMRVIQGMRAAWSGLRESAVRLAANSAEFLSEESRLLAARPSFADHLADLVELEHEIDLLAAAVDRLTQNPASHASSGRS